MDRPVAQYWDDLKTVLLKPHQFFRRMPRNAGFAQPLAFALIAHWIGSAIAFLWNSAFIRSSEEAFEKWAAIFGNNDQIDVIRRSSSWEQARHAFTNWFWGIGSVIGDPFWTLASLLISSFFVFVGARLLVGVMSDAPSAAPGEQHRHEVTYESAVRIMAYGAVASIFQVIPFAGKFIAYFYSLYISVVGAKEIYRIRTGRALTVVLFPQVLIFAILLPILAILFLVGISLFWGLLSGGT
ncbi:MAG: YIP1 family protein [Bdellovibrionia bacterium]